VLVGYDYPNRSFLVRNSWSAAWGLRGHFIMPFEYVLRSDLSNDFWTVQIT
jgi:C1A family cysteine protease